MRIPKGLWLLPPIHQRFSTVPDWAAVAGIPRAHIHHNPRAVLTGPCAGGPHEFVAKDQQLPHSGRSEEDRRTFHTTFGAKPSQHLGQLSVSHHPLTARPQEVRPTRSPILCTQSLLNYWQSLEVMELRSRWEITCRSGSVSMLSPRKGQTVLKHPGCTEVYHCCALTHQVPQRPTLEKSSVGCTESWSMLSL